MLTFRKKPVVIEAIQVSDENLYELLDLMKANQSLTVLCVTDGENRVTNRIHSVQIQTLEGTMTGSLGDWIIKGVNGEFYPCKPDIFQKTYEPVMVQTEQGYKVWRYDLRGDQYWVAAKTEKDANAEIRERRPHECQDETVHAELEPNLDQDGFQYGDSEDGEEPVPCTLRDLVKWHWGFGTQPAMLIAETNY